MFNKYYLYKQLLIKNIFTLCFICLLQSQDIEAQGGVWARYIGAYSTGTADIDTSYYGIKGIYAKNNIPPMREFDAQCWTDKDGKFWLFGGSGEFVLTNDGKMNDLWEFDPDIRQWRWVNGPRSVSAQSGVYGIKGVPSSSNFPSARSFAATWVDTSGDLWMYGGYGIDSSGVNRILLGDLWRYHISTNEWTYMEGYAGLKSYIKFGSRGVESTSNSPGPRDKQSTWVDNNNNLWFYGGSADTFPSACMNDLWKYNISSGKWTWMKGVPSLSASTIYGTKGIENDSIQPTPLVSSCHWQDDKGFFYLYGGYNSYSNMATTIWRFNPQTNNWTWLYGKDTADNDTGKYISKCAPGVGYPSTSLYNATPQTMGCTHLFWTFGGILSYSAITTNGLWTFNTQTLEWTWVSGRHLYYSDTGHLGTPGLFSPSNLIPAVYGMCLWTDKENNLWVFGGSSFLGYLSNMMWEFVPDTSCFHTVLGTSIYKGRDTIICQGHCISVSTKYMPSAYSFPTPDSVLHNDTMLFKPNSTTTYTIYFNSTGCKGKIAMRFTIYIKPAPLSVFNITPNKSIISNTIIKIHNLTKYAGTQTWQLNGNTFSHTLIDSSITLPAVAGKYAITLIVKSDSNGCIDTLTKWVDVIDTALLFVPTAFSPNSDGVNDMLYAIVPSANVKLKTFKIYNRWGQEVFETQSLDKGWDGTFNGKPEDVGTYVYYVEAESTTNGKSLFTKGTVTLVR